MTKLSDLPNIGPTVEAQLQRVGITTPQELQAVGAKDAWLRIQATDPSACIQRLQALEGAIRGVKKSQLPPDVKADLKAFYQQHKIAQ
ncbi:MAG: TfoX/Sxy family protein [Coriobacteriia bacterium]|nr:TfoX/Sxy family protein [Coriobacteriia bacterium]